MSLQQLPQLNANSIKALKFDATTSALEKWQPEIRAKNEDNAITIYEQIGVDYWTGEGVTAKRIRGALRAIGEKDIVVNINSPGGDFFEGVAIYNELIAHKGKVTVNVMGLAASAASVIAMSGDEINIGEGAFLMIHNAWSVAVGNRHDLQAVAEQLAPFDDAMASLYAKKTGIEKVDIVEMMDKETWLNTEKSIELGFANNVLEENAITHEQIDSNAKALSVIEKALAKDGMPRSQRRELFKQIFTSTPSATQTVTPSANEKIAEQLQNLIETIRN